MPRQLPRWLQPAPGTPDTLGWRAWLWNAEHQCLQSPHWDTIWPDAVARAESWDDDSSVRGVAGIHARLVPAAWRVVGWPDDDASAYLDPNPLLITGIVERFGRYVLGTEGWRAEQVVIRELLAPTTEVGLLLEQRYPDTIVHYSDQVQPWTSAKSSESANANLTEPPPLLRPDPPQIPDRQTRAQIRRQPTPSPPSIPFQNLPIGSPGGQQQNLQSSSPWNSPGIGPVVDRNQEPGKLPDR